MKGVRLSDITWEEAAEIIKGNPIVLLPIGGGTKEHGPHLPCGTDLFVVEELAKRVAEEFPVLLLPALPYAYYPAFVDFPGSVSIEAEHFTAIVGDIIRSFQRHGINRFLILDGGVSTHDPLKILARDLHNELGILIAVTNILGLGAEVEAQLAEQEVGGHADEIETSNMLVIRPNLVKMDKAVKEVQSAFPGTIKEGIRKVYLASKMTTRSGINGDARLATHQKGEKMLSAMTADILEFLHNFSAMTSPFDQEQ